MPPAAITMKAIPATAKAAIMKSRVFFRMASLAVIRALPTKSADQTDPIDRQHGDRDAVRGDDEVPAAGHDSIHTASPSSSGGGAISVSRRSEAMRARSMIKPTITK